ncbi:MAG: UDP-N-acetylmuramate dehydrogenase [Deltaproteobacteria bacterium]|nr:UDP-N-acetylmuramate dehydrogenase [Deltaproteobacteria bacterium]
MALPENVKKWLSSRFAGCVEFDAPMDRHTSIRVGGPADALVFPDSRETLGDLMAGAWDRGVGYLVVGDGSNLLVSDRGISGIVICLTRCLNTIEMEPDGEQGARLFAGAGVRTKLLCRHCLKHGLAGMNFALGIPGTIGGAIRMNAGTLAGWMSDMLDSIELIYPMGKPKRVYKDEFLIGYRKINWYQVAEQEKKFPPVILGGSFILKSMDRQRLRKEAREIVKKRLKGQPMGAPSAGCFFKNPKGGKPAGWLIENAGLKGRCIGGAMISGKHANFIVNSDNATANDIMRLMNMVQEAVFKKFHVKLEPEVQIVGESTDS